LPPPPPPPPLPTHTLGRSMVLNDSKIQKIKREEEEEEEGEKSIGRGKLTILLRSIRWTLVVKVLHHVPEHLIVFFIYSIAPLDIVP